ncbi:MAG: putative glycosyltransferase CsbB [Candidatus Accumulibacter sp. BA-94]|jgi:glycosyltransferase involved in cell wall biosynthesis|uniref:glycosyltransferase family 2 protein n=1 Tax=Accumulibacter sp. TaxID=2053492 RepID=UPI00044B814F|nr:MAG: putative glycosyltransferase CsbB [Candidatus Accumulibacter sp. BA-94]
MKLISVVTGCFNEEDNVEELHSRIRAQFERLPAYDYEHIFIDNASTDSTVARIKAMAANDRRVKLIVNARNFGHIRSPMHALLQARGDAVIAMASDLQEPPELIPEFVHKWEQGYRVVAGVRSGVQNTVAMSFIRRAFYATIGRISETRLIPNFTGFGLYDRSVVEVVRQVDDPYPYFRGLIADIGFDHAEVPFVQPQRRRGISKNNFYTLYDMAILGITSHSKLPIRLATMAGFALSGLSLLVAVGYLAYKLLRWDQFSVGMAPVVIGFFFFASVQLFFIGILGEYIAAIHTQVLRRPLVVEKERVNFDAGGTDV